MSSISMLECLGSFPSMFVAYIDVGPNTIQVLQSNPYATHEILSTRSWMALSTHPPTEVVSKMQHNNC